MQFLSTPSARRATYQKLLKAIAEGFLSTPSARRATEIVKAKMTLTMISIHALREEGDTTSQRGETASLNFYPRPPRGGRLAEYAFAKHLPEISIHALREEGDS